MLLEKVSGGRVQRGSSHRDEPFGYPLYPLRAIARVLLQKRHDQVHERSREYLSLDLRGPGWLEAVGHRVRCRRGVCKHLPPDQQVIEDAAKAIEITLSGDPMTRALLG
jgi:hypothetical protein